MPGSAKNHQTVEGFVGSRRCDEEPSAAMSLRRKTRDNPLYHPVKCQCPTLPFRSCQVASNCRLRVLPIAAELGAATLAAELLGRVRADLSAVGRLVMDYVSA
jgi:hypothetical protein